LTADEILDTVLLVRKSGLLVDRITLMGMGEAFLNPHIWEALLLLCHRDHLGLSPQRISLSTVGVVPGIQRLTKEFPSVTLTFSFHFPFQSERDRWMPLGKTYPLEDVFKSLDNHAAKTGKKIYLAYIVFEGLNDDERHAHQLKDWITQRPYPHLFHLNLLPYHTTAGISLPPSTPKGVRAFYNRLRQMGLAVTVRQSFGHEIQAACGQLAAGYGVG
jgi:23S rRNA (adenine-C8)-methyltransferase